MIYMAIWLWLVGILVVNALSHQASTSKRTWQTRLSVIFWPITSTVGLIGDLYDLIRTGKLVDWMLP